MSETFTWKLKLGLRCDGVASLPYGFYLYKEINAPWPLARGDYAKGDETQILDDVAAWERDYLNGQKVRSVEWKEGDSPEYTIWLKTVKLAAGKRKDLEKEIAAYLAAGWKRASEEEVES